MRSPPLLVVVHLPTQLVEVGLEGEPGRDLLQALLDERLVVVMASFRLLRAGRVLLLFALRES